MANQPTILIVEDDPDTRNLVSRIVQVTAPASRILTAVDGEAGLSLALQDRPDLVITDLGIPKLDGHDMVESLHQRLNGTCMPVLGTSAHDLGDPKAHAFHQLCDAFVSKPFDVEDLWKKVEQLMGPRTLAQPALA